MGAVFRIAIAFLVLLSAAGWGQPESGLVLQATPSLDRYAWSPNEKLIAAASRTDNRIYVFSAKSGLVLTSITGFRGEISDFRWSSDGTLLAGVSEGGSVVVWSAERGTNLWRKEARVGELESLTWSPDAKHLAVGGDGGLALYDVRTGEKGGTAGERYIWGLDWSKDGQTIAVSTLHKVAILGAKDLKEQVVLDEKNGSHTLLVSPNGRFMAGNKDKKVWVWDLQRNQLQSSFARTDSVTQLSWHPAGHLAVNAIGGFTLHDPLTGQVVQRLPKAGFWGTQVWSRAGDRLLGHSGGTRGIIDLASAKVLVGLRRWETFGGSTLEFSPTGKMLLVSGVTNKLWSLERGDLLKELQRNPIGWGETEGTFIADGPVIFDEPDGSVKQTLAENEYLATRSVDRKTVASFDDSSKRINVRRVDGRSLCRIPCPEKLDFPEQLVLSPNGRYVGASRNENHVFWRTSDASPRLEVKGHCSWSPDGQTLASVTAYGTSSGPLAIKRWSGSDLEASSDWSMERTEETRYLSSAYGLVWSADSKALLSLHNGVAILWRANGARILPQSESTSFRSHAAWSNSGELALYSEGQVRLYRSDGTLKLKLQGDVGELNALSWSPDGDLLATLGDLASVKLWNPQTGEPLITFGSGSNNNWYAVTPDGFFDGNRNGWRRIYWRLADSGLEQLVPGTAFFREFYSPGVLGEIVREKRPFRQILAQQDDSRASARLPRSAPALPLLDLRLAEPESLKYRGRLILAGRAEFEVEVKGSVTAHDIKLFRSGTLVKQWPGAHPPGTRLKAELHLDTLGQFEAHAYTKEGVRGESTHLGAPGAFSWMGDDGIMVVSSTMENAHLITAGVDDYRSDARNLNFAASDARALSKALSNSLEKSIGDNLNQRIHSTTLINEEATREAILSSIAQLEGQLGHDDIAFISFSGHGVYLDGKYYLLPYDANTPDKPELVKQNGIDFEDLAERLAPLQTGKVCLILDTCHSGGVLQSSEKNQGPWNDRSLAQLGYDKGMTVLAASQTNEAALEAWSLNGRKLGHGLLTYALLERLTAAESSGESLAVSDWLQDAVERVPQLLNAQENKRRDFAMSASATSNDKRQAFTQKPRLLLPRHKTHNWIVSGQRGQFR